MIESKTKKKRMKLQINMCVNMFNFKAYLKGLNASIKKSLI